MSFYQNLQDTASRLIESKGKSCTLRKQTSEDYNPATGTSNIIINDFSTYGVLLNYTQSQINAVDSLVELTDRKAIIKGNVTPDVSDLFIFDGVTYSIISIKTINPSGLVVIHEMQVRV
jgi:hypothetical protein